MSAAPENFAHSAADADEPLAAATLSILIATLDSTVCMLEVASFSDHDVWTSNRGRDSEETGTESDMTEGTEETITDPEEVPAKRSRRGVPRKPRVPARPRLQNLQG